MSEIEWRGSWVKVRFRGRGGRIAWCVQITAPRAKDQPRGGDAVIIGSRQTRGVVAAYVSCREAKRNEAKLAGGKGAVLEPWVTHLVVVDA